MRSSQTGTANDILNLGSLSGTLTLTAAMPAINSGVSINGSAAQDGGPISQGFPAESIVS